ncbi:MAG TPA: peptide MFS transporter, partial [Chitinophagales bacterium]|nr:peptide MFS transporter [Chitinophagales bacterium]
MSTASTSHPKGLYVLFFTEMWERFSYYGMRAIFFLYLINAIRMSNEDASNIYGSYTGLVYLTPLLGGYIADKYWGNRRSILVGGILMAIGQFLMFGSGAMLGSGMDVTLMLGGLFFLILGNGFFKPNISTMVGQLYPEGDKRIDGAFTIFYMGINLGAFFSPLVCGTLGDTGDPADFKWGFLAAGIGMIISVLSFEMLKNKYLVRPDGSPVGMPASHVHNPTLHRINEANQSSDGAVNRLNAPDIAPQKETPNFTSTQIMTGLLVMAGAFAAFLFAMKLDLIGSLIFASAFGVPVLIITDKSLTSNERARIWVIFILAFFVIFFWSAFEQAGASLTYFADKQTDRSIGATEVPASYFQSINPLGIIILAPLFSWLWVRLGAANAEPSSPLKMGLGLLLLCFGYVVIAFGVQGIDPSEDVRVSMWWLVALYVLHTMGELCLSPIGLSMV